MNRSATSAGTEMSRCMHIPVVIASTGTSTNQMKEVKLNETKRFRRVYGAVPVLRE